MNESTWVNWMFHSADAWINAGANFAIQSSILIALGLIASYVLRRKSAALQSAVLRTTLVAVLFSPLFSLLLIESGIPGLTISLPKSVTEAAPATDAQIRPEIANALNLSEMDYAQPSPLEPTQYAESEFDAPIAALDAPPLTLSVTQEEPSSLPSITLSTLYVALFGAWMIGTFLLTVHLILRYVSAIRLKRNARPADSAIENRCRALAERLGLQAPSVLTHEKVRNPFLLGYRRPAILFPKASDYSQLASTEVIVHELAHLARRDVLWNYLCRISECLFFFQPLVWLLDRRIETTNDDVCDDYVIQHTQDRKTYATQLVSFAERLQPAFSERAIGAGVITFRSVLGKRVQRIMNGSRSLTLRVGRAATVAIVLTAFLGSMLTGSIGFKNESALAQSEETNPTTEDRFIAKLSSNVDVELIAVGEHPMREGGWWKPNGEPLARAPFASENGQDLREDANNIRRKFVLRVIPHDAEDFQTGDWDIEGANGGCISKCYDGEGYKIEGMYCASFWIRNKYKTNTVRYKIAKGDWKTATFIKKEEWKEKEQLFRRIDRLGGCVLHKPYQDGERVRINVSMPDPSNKVKIRLLALGNPLWQIAEQLESTTYENLMTCAFSFENVQLEEIDKIDFQILPYEWAEFSNVSLYPNQKTNVAVKNYSLYESDGVNTPPSPQDKQTQTNRVESETEAASPGDLLPPLDAQWNEDKTELAVKLDDDTRVSLLAVLSLEGRTISPNRIPFDIDKWVAELPDINDVDVSYDFITRWRREERETIERLRKDSTNAPFLPVGFLFSVERDPKKSDLLNFDHNYDSKVDTFFPSGIKYQPISLKRHFIFSYGEIYKDERTLDIQTRMDYGPYFPETLTIPPDATNLKRSIYGRDLLIDVKSVSDSRNNDDIQLTMKLQQGNPLLGFHPRVLKDNQLITPGSTSYREMKWGFDSVTTDNIDGILFRGRRIRDVNWKDVALPNIQKQIDELWTIETSSADNTPTTSNADLDARIRTLSQNVDENTHITLIAALTPDRGDRLLVDGSPFDYDDWSDRVSERWKEANIEFMSQFIIEWKKGILERLKTNRASNAAPYVPIGLLYSINYNGESDEYPSVGCFEESDMIEGQSGIGASLSKSRHIAFTAYSLRSDAPALDLTLPVGVGPQLPDVLEIPANPGELKTTFLDRELTVSVQDFPATPERVKETNGAPVCEDLPTVTVAFKDGESAPGYHIRAMLKNGDVRGGLKHPTQPQWTFYPNKEINLQDIDCFLYCGRKVERVRFNNLTLIPNVKEEFDRLWHNR